MTSDYTSTAAPFRFKERSHHRDYRKKYWNRNNRQPSFRLLPRCLWKAVYCVLPDFVVRAIETAPKTSEKFFFWTGKSTLHTAVGIWQRSLQKLFTLAKVEGGHAHRFRDTFAVELLLAGVPLERVSVLLGHQSVKITEKHYSPWVRSRQEQLEQDLKRVWKQDPIAVMETKGTSEVHRRKEQIN